MSADPRLAAALQPLVRRASVVEFWKYSMPALVVALVASQTLALAGFRNVFVPLALMTGALAISAVAAVKRRPTLLGVARRVDLRAGLQDLVVTALDARGDGLAVLVRNDALAAVARQNPRDIYPIEPPTGWRRMTVAAIVAEAVLMGLTWQAPVRRASTTSLASMVLPAGSSSATSGALQTPQKRDDTRPAADPTSPSRTAVSTKPGGVVVTAADVDGAKAPAAATSGADRIRLATANAESAIAAGRVPAAKRAMVERYFAALQAQRKTPR